MTWTIWGKAQTSKSYQRGIISYTTASHGGFHVSNKLNQSIHEVWRNKEGWYEEDCAWAIVPFSFPNLFNDKEKKDMLSTLKNWFPKEYMIVTGEIVSLDESCVLREEKFYTDNKDNYITLAAWGDWHKNVPTGCVGVYASIGERSNDINGKYFLVPKTEYHSGIDKNNISFVVDTNRHKEISPIK